MCAHQFVARLTSIVINAVCYVEAAWQRECYIDVSNREISVPNQCDSPAQLQEQESVFMHLFGKWFKVIAMKLWTTARIISANQGKRPTIL